MSFIINHPTSIAIIITILVMFSTSIIQWTFLIGLKRKHPNQWRHAGSPTIWTDQSFLSAWPTIKYLYTKKYLLSTDNDGIEFCHGYRLPMVFGYWFTVIVFIIAVLISVYFGMPDSWV